MNYKMKDINNIYTEIIKNYINEGYNIYTEPMGGSQGEIAKIFLECNNNIICVYMTEFHDYYDFVDGIFIIVGVFDRFNAYDENSRDTIWFKDLNCISTYRYFEISKHKYYTDDCKFALSCRKKHIKRFDNRKYNKNETFNSNEFKEFAYKKCKKTKGYKNVRKKDIKEIIKKYGNYFAKIEGKYALRLNKQSLNYNVGN